jgi:glycogen debranching enzyme
MKELNNLEHPYPEQGTDMDPEQIILFPHESLVEVRQLEVSRPDRPPSAIRALARLCGVSLQTGDESTLPIRERIGENGPSLASCATEARSDEADFRKYEALFGRDSLRVALDLADHHPLLLEATVLRHAELQGTRDNPKNEEEPGRIIHEYREDDDPIAIQISEQEGWGWPYYGSIDATPMFISAIHKLVELKGEEVLEKTIRNKDGQELVLNDALRFATMWLEQKLETSPDGLLEFHMRNGIENQVWKDSPDSYMHEDATLADHSQGIASIEVQALAYDALRDASDLHRTNNPDVANRLASRAEHLKAQVHNHFWVGEGGYFALGADRDEEGQLRPLKVKSSNMGHLLNSGILYSEEGKDKHRVESLIRTLFSREMLGKYGVRTLAETEQRYRDGAYHNGSVWLWDSLHIAEGLHKHGYHGLATELKARAMLAIEETHIFPEYVRGGHSKSASVCNDKIIDVWDDDLKKKNRIQQPPQEIQAWTVSVILRIKRQYQPLDPKKGLPLAAIEEDKKAFENELLNTISLREDDLSDNPSLV